MRKKESFTIAWWTEYLQNELQNENNSNSLTNETSQIDTYTIVTSPIVNYIPVDKESVRIMLRITFLHE